MICFSSTNSIQNIIAIFQHCFIVIFMTASNGTILYNTIFKLHFWQINWSDEFYWLLLATHWKAFADFGFIKIIYRYLVEKVVFFVLLLKNCIESYLNIEWYRIWMIVIHLLLICCYIFVMRMHNENFSIIYFYSLVIFDLSEYLSMIIIS